MFFEATLTSEVAYLGEVTNLVQLDTKVLEISRTSVMEKHEVSVQV